ncbi:MAG: hypothetical protein JWN71_3026 [Xanthobacteraceae bacterium]|nr:hypothetical protein [Xanthobacteraceae bacterium]
MSDIEPVADSDPHYAYKPSLMGGASQFWLRSGGLEWHVRSATGVVPYARIDRVRMSFRPVTAQSYRFLTEVRAPGARMTIVSSSWKSLFEQERQDAGYRAFVTELHRRIAAAGRATQFVSGYGAPLYWVGLAIFTATVCGFAVMILRALLTQVWAGAGFVAAFLALFLWQVGGYFRRNRPGTYRPDALPPLLLP